MADYRKNLANAVVGTMTASTTATTIPLASGYGATMPDVPYFMTFTPPGQLSTLGNSEIVLVSARSADSLTIVRGQKGTTAKPIGTGWLGSASILRETSLAVGDIQMTLNTSPQSGRVFMAGQTLNKADYPLLYDHVVNNPAYGSTTTTTFTLADMRGRVPAGKAASGTFATLGGNLGEETHQHDNGNYQALAEMFTTGGIFYIDYAKSSTVSYTANARHRVSGSAANETNTETQSAGIRVGGSSGFSSSMQPTLVVNYEVVAG